MTKRLKTLLIALSLVGSLLTGCGEEAREGPTDDESAAESQLDEEQIEVTASFLPVYLLTLEVAEGVEGLELDWIIDPAAGDPHNYQLRPEDRAKLERADAVVINGLGLESFLRGVLDELEGEKPIIVATAGIEPLPARDDGHGGHHGAGHEDDHEAGHDEGHEEEQDEGHHEQHGEYNPHVWTSPLQAARMAETIAESLGELLPDQQELFAENAAALAEELRSIHEELVAVVEAAENNRVVVNHDAFPYLARDVGLEIVGLLNANPGAPLSAGELAELAREVELNVAAAIFVEPQYPDDAGRTLAEMTGLPVHTLDPGATGEARLGWFVELQRENLAALRAALLGE